MHTGSSLCGGAGTGSYLNLKCLPVREARRALSCALFPRNSRIVHRISGRPRVVARALSRGSITPGSRPRSPATPGEPGEQPPGVLTIQLSDPESPPLVSRGHCDLQMSQFAPLLYHACECGEI